MPRPRVAVATSGGLDSTALLHCTQSQARLLGVDVVALHVHHGLMAEANAWLNQVREQARRWGAGFCATRLSGHPLPGESIEAWAREQRYAALAAMAQNEGCSLVLLAHHRRDQAETFLLQALRGAGDAGLSGMPRQQRRSRVDFARPWLDLPRGHIEAYAKRHRLKWVDDASNHDARLARSRLRGAVWPALLRAFPDAEASLARAASLAQSSAALAEEVASEDLARIGAEHGLPLAEWLGLSLPRRTAALRTWLARQCGVPAPFQLVQRLLVEVPRANTGEWQAPEGVLRLYRGRLTWEPLSSGAAAVAAPCNADLSFPQVLRLPAWNGCLAVESCEAGGVPAALLRIVQVHARQGGEQFQMAPRALARSLKKQFQSLAVPAWQRRGPLVSLPSGELIFVPGLGMDARRWASPGQPQLRLEWVPDGLEATGPGQAPG